MLSGYKYHLHLWRSVSLNMSHSSAKDELVMCWSVGQSREVAPLLMRLKRGWLVPSLSCAIICLDD